MKLQNLYRIFGRDAVLLPVPMGAKKPRIKAWQEITAEQTMSKAYQRKLAWFAEHGNIGVRQGPNLQSIDIDDDQLAKRFLEANPALQSTTITKGKRGIQIHVRIKDTERSERFTNSPTKRSATRKQSRLNASSGVAAAESEGVNRSCPAFILTG